MNRITARFGGFRLHDVYPSRRCFRNCVRSHAERSTSGDRQPPLLSASVLSALSGFLAVVFLVLSGESAEAQSYHSGSGRGSIYQPGYSIGSKWERNPSGDQYGQFSGGPGQGDLHPGHFGNGPHHGSGHHEGGLHGNSFPGSGPGWGYGPGSGGYPMWNSGYQYPAGFIYGGYPIAPPPAWIRNSDGALFIAPGFLPPYGYGYPNGYWFGPDGGFRYGTGGGFYNPGYAQGYDSSSGSMVLPLPGMIPSFMTFSFGSQNLSALGFRSSAGYSVVPRIQPFLPRESMTDERLPPRMKVTPGAGDSLLAPIPDETLPPIDEKRTNGDGADDAEDLPVPAPGDASRPPVVDEFSPIPVTHKKTSLQDRLLSIRQQAGGDEAFRHRDMNSAVESYQAAIDTAPERRAPYLRMTFALLQQSKFPEAVSYLKTGLNLEDDSTRAWITSKELYGGTATELIQTSSRRLWAWVTEKPLSTDRLLLMGAFQKWRGMNRTGDDVITAIEQTQSSNSYVMALRGLTDYQSAAVVNVRGRGPSGNAETRTGRTQTAPRRFRATTSSEGAEADDSTTSASRDESSGVESTGVTPAEQVPAARDELIIPPIGNSR